MTFNAFCFIRFLYPIYPLICVAASAVIESFPDLFRNKYDAQDDSILVTVIVTTKSLLVISQELFPVRIDLLVCLCR